LIEDASMAPTYERGDVAIVQDDPDVTSLEPDDVIRFRRGGTSVLRRIVAVEDHPDGLEFVTRGDNADRSDPPVAADRIEGKVVFHVSNLGHVSLWLRGEPDPPFGEARTYYQSLDLSSPLAAARTFVDAFHWDDFMTVWLALDADAQFTFRQDFNQSDYEHLIASDHIDDFGAELREAWTIDDPERSIDAWYLFDQVMLIADRHDAFLIDLSGTVTFGDEDVAGRSAEVPAQIEGIDGDVIFRLTGSEAGRWRIHQVIVPGGDETRIPWSVPSDRP
jgi:hypothetical protein